MTRPRSELVSLPDTPYYHCICRCVRRAHLCGEDKLTGQDYSHRKKWVINRLKQLQQVFTIDLCAYAIMGNHYHLVLHVNKAAAEALNEMEVVTRWHHLFKLPSLVSRYLSGSAATVAEQRKAQEKIADWRERLSDLSWYMRCLNEYIARKANAEDSCTGRFWEGRFRSQAILDEAGLLTCMTYVDLNPLRAGVVNMPEDAVDVSFHQRLRQHMELKSHGLDVRADELLLLPFIEPFQRDKLCVIPFSFSDYRELITWASKAKRERHSMALKTEREPSVLAGLGLNGDDFLTVITPRYLSRGTVIGHAVSKAHHARVHHRRCVQGPHL